MRNGVQAAFCPTNQTFQFIISTCCSIFPHFERSDIWNWWNVVRLRCWHFDVMEVWNGEMLKNLNLDILKTDNIRSSRRPRIHQHHPSINILRARVNSSALSTCSTVTCCNFWNAEMFRCRHVEIVEMFNCWSVGLRRHWRWSRFIWNGIRTSISISFNILSILLSRCWLLASRATWDVPYKNKMFHSQTRLPTRKWDFLSTHDIPFLKETIQSQSEISTHACEFAFQGYIFHSNVVCSIQQWDSLSQSDACLSQSDIFPSKDEMLHPKSWILYRRDMFPIQIWNAPPKVIFPIQKVYFPFTCEIVHPKISEGLQLES